MDNIDPASTPRGSVAEHTIGVVERRTGVSQHLLRAWERRYGAVAPARTETGHRLYSDDDVERLRLVRSVSAAGRRVGQVISLPLDQLRELARNDVLEAMPRTPSESGPTSIRASMRASIRANAEDHLRACLDSVQRIDGSMTYVLLMRAAAALDARTFIEGVAAPLLQIVGDSWESGISRPANEHSLSGALRRVLSWLLDALRAPVGAPLIVFGTLPDQRHEFGAMFAAIIAASRQWRVSYLGGDLPIDDIAYSALLARADVVAVSVIRSPDLRVLRRDLEHLRAALPDSIPLVVGGHAAAMNARALSVDGTLIVTDLDAWERWLDATAAARSLRPATSKPPDGVSAGIPHGFDVPSPKARRSLDETPGR